MDRRAILASRIGAMPFAAASRGAIRIGVAIAGVRLDLLTHSLPLASRLESYFAEFRDADAGPPLAEVVLGVLEDGGRELWDDPDAEFSRLGGLVIQRDLIARDEGAPSPGGPRRVVSVINPYGDDGFHNLLRWLIAPLLLEGADAFLMHAAGVVHDGRGYVFFGQSGAGKSTCASLIHASDPEATLLGDDAVIIRMRDRAPYLESAPLGCGYSRAAPPRQAVPLAGLFALEQARHDERRPMPRSEAVARLLASAMCADGDVANAARIELALRFASMGPGISLLRFTRDTAFWPLARSNPSEDLA